MTRRAASPYQVGGHGRIGQEALDPRRTAPTLLGFGLGSPLVIACGDGNYALGSPAWASWGAPAGSATGTAVVNDCEPYCAAGHFHSYPVQVTLSRVIRCGTGRRYGLVSVRFPKTRPPGYARTVSTPFTCRY